jgi:hypothetical protein
MNRCPWANEVWCNEIHEHPTNFVRTSIFFDEAFKYGDGAKF